MNNINLNELRNRAYKTACEHGFHDKELSNEHCLCLIVGELMEAVDPVVMESCFTYSLCGVRGSG